MTQTPTEERSLGQLVAQAMAQAQKLFKAEIELAKAELKEDAKRAGLAGGMFGGAAFLGYFGALFCSVAAAFGIHALGITLGWSFLIVGGAYLVLAGMVGFVGKRNIDKMPKVNRTKQTIQDDVAWAKSLKEEFAAAGEGAKELTPGEERPAITR